MTVLRLSFPLRVEPLPFRRGTCAVPSHLVTQDESRHEKDGKRCFLPAFSHFQNDKVFGFFLFYSSDQCVFVVVSIIPKVHVVRVLWKNREAQTREKPSSTWRAGELRPTPPGVPEEPVPRRCGPGAQGWFPFYTCVVTVARAGYRPRESPWVPGRSNRYLGRTPVTCTKHC